MADRDGDLVSSEGASRRPSRRAGKPVSKTASAQGRRCQETDCERPHVARGRCSLHYRRFIRDGGLGTSCAMPDCDGGVWAKTLCLPHHSRASRYGLTVEDLILVDAREFCDICTNAPAVVDHDHTTGAVRGVLCGPCNRALGLFQDDASRLVSAIQYLTNPPGA